MIVKKIDILIDVHLKSLFKMSVIIIHWESGLKNTLFEYFTLEQFCKQEICNFILSIFWRTKFHPERKTYQQLTTKIKSLANVFPEGNVP